ncbi:hypothetical protein EC973_003701 [Apophysomyces ossiformis]|uniref:NOT2/NOT3/NOT5 C-terminal domain-containing protein n=1 Tax=Apophysomyces ossiformis TaxID=679940 RepID=A0A8H7BL49_9FUNG|nr:hypothetical protein EC973_003701 [Apophysomyces ossiformis]
MNHYGFHTTNYLSASMAPYLKDGRPSVHPWLVRQSNEKIWLGKAPPSLDPLGLPAAQIQRTNGFTYASAIQGKSKNIQKAFGLFSQKYRLAQPSCLSQQQQQPLSIIDLDGSPSILPPLDHLRSSSPLPTMDEFPALPQRKESIRTLLEPKQATIHSSLTSDAQNPRDQLRSKNDDEEELAEAEEGDRLLDFSEKNRYKGDEMLGSRYNLSGLLNMARQTNPDNHLLVLGQDLSILGLDMNSSNDLYSTFESPWDDDLIEPDFRLPPCYTMRGLPPIENMLPSLSTETLFYMFYAYTRDVLQDLAAQEL